MQVEGCLSFFHLCFFGLFLATAALHSTLQYITIKMFRAEDKITTRENLADRVASWRKEGKIVGFTSGSFDILHAGHVAYLEEAKEKCDVLIAAINSDNSVRGYKGPGRPIIPEDARLQTVAALASVDYALIFDELDNRSNIEILKPSLYIKGGDYAPEQLESADVLKKYGGDILILPFKDGFSSSGIIAAIADLYGGGVPEISTQAVSSSDPGREPRGKAILVDRDGVINEDIEYLHEPEKFKLLPNAGEGLKKFQDMGFRVALITLQAGIGLGYFTKEDFFKVNREMFKQLKPHGVILNKVYFAERSTTKDGRNPKEDLVKRGLRELNADPKKSFVIGDKTADLSAGKPFGCLKIGMKTGHGLADQEYTIQPDYIATDLLDAADWVESQNL